MSNFCRRKLSDNEKYELLENPWTPDATFKFPPSTKRNLKFQLSWLHIFPWLSYSASEDGAYCRFCVLFVQTNIGKGRHEVANMLVQSPFKDWKKALNKFKDHQRKNYHTEAFEDVQNFKAIFENKKSDIVSDIDQGRKQMQWENRKKLMPIIRSVLLCGRQGLALRGHRDQGQLSMNFPEDNDGNFRALLRFASESGDTALNQHLATAGGNSMYLSFRIQNEIVDAASEIITKEIVNRINISKCFSVTADETTDVSGIEQFTICVRYVHKIGQDSKIREDFLCFVPVVNVTGKGLAETLLSTLEKLGLDLLFMKAQGMFIQQFHFTRLDNPSLIRRDCMLKLPQIPRTFM